MQPSPVRTPAWLKTSNSSSESGTSTTFSSFVLRAAGGGGVRRSDYLGCPLWWRGYLWYALKYGLYGEHAFRYGFCGECAFWNRAEEKKAWSCYTDLV